MLSYDEQLFPDNLNLEHCYKRLHVKCIKHFKEGNCKNYTLELLHSIKDQCMIEKTKYL